MNLLLEIGCEEIPDWMLAGALEYLGDASAPWQNRTESAAPQSAPTPRLVAWSCGPKV